MQKDLESSMRLFLLPAVSAESVPIARGHQKYPVRVKVSNQGSTSPDGSANPLDPFLMPIGPPLNGGNGGGGSTTGICLVAHDPNDLSGNVTEYPRSFQIPGSEVLQIILAPKQVLVAKSGQTAQVLVSVEAMVLAPETYDHLVYW